MQRLAAMAWLAMLLAGTDVLAQGTPAEPVAVETDDTSALEDAAEAAPVYDIELIVFAYADGIRGRSEDFAYEDTGRAAVLAERESLLGTPGRGFGAVIDEMLPDPADVSAVARALEFTPLPTAEWRLADTGAALERREGFVRLLHTAWRQPVYGPGEETTIDLARVGLLAPELGGTASVYVTRFLHLTLELEFAGRAAPVPSPETLVYRLTERRKMRSTELHFFDHPRFGALALITPFETGDALEPDGADAPDSPAG